MQGLLLNNKKKMRGDWEEKYMLQVFICCIIEFIEVLTKSYNSYYY